MMRRTRAIGALLAGGLALAATCVAEEPQYDWQIVLLKVPPEAAKFEAGQGSMSGGAFVGSGQLSITWGDSTFKSDGANLLWNGAELPLRREAPSPGTSVKVLGAPRMTTSLHDGSIQVKAGVNEPAQYFEREPDGRFALHTMPVEAAALSLSFTFEKTSTPDALLVGWKCDLSQLGERRPLPGVSLPVGQPEIRKVSAQASGDVKLGQWRLIALRESSDLAVFFRILPHR